MQTSHRETSAPKEDIVAAALFSTSKLMTAAGAGGGDFGIRQW